MRLALVFAAGLLLPSSLLAAERPWQGLRTALGKPAKVMERTVPLNLNLDPRGYYANFESWDETGIAKQILKALDLSGVPQVADREDMEVAIMSVHCLDAMNGHALLIPGKGQAVFRLHEGPCTADIKANRYTTPYMQEFTVGMTHGKEAGMEFIHLIPPSAITIRSNGEPHSQIPSPEKIREVLQAYFTSRFTPAAEFEPKLAARKQAMQIDPAAITADGLAYTRAYRLWEEFRDDLNNADCFESNLCIRDGDDRRLIETLRKTARACFYRWQGDLHECSSSERRNYDFDNRKVFTGGILQDVADCHRDTLSQLPSLDERKRHLRLIKEVQAACQVQINVAAEIHNSMMRLATVEHQLPQCQQALNLYASKNAAWKEQWISYYLPVRKELKDPRVVEAIKGRSPECIPGHGNPEFQEAAATVVAEHEAAEKARIATAEREEMERKQAAAIAMQEQQAAEAESQKHLAVREQQVQERRRALNVKAQRAGFKGINFGFGLAMLAKRSMSGTELSDYEGWLFEPGFYDQYAAFQVTDANVLYSICGSGNCPTIMITKAPSKTYVQGQAFDRSWFYEYLGVRIYTNALGTTSTALLFKPVRLSN